MADDDMSEETRERLERERQARVHQEAHEPTGDWIELADDPDEAKRVADRYTPTITNDAAKDALKIYVQFAGKPHDAMRAAILSVLPGLTLGREQEAFRRGVAIGKALNFTGPDEGDEDEEDCLNCGSDDEEHEEGCPREAESGG